ncbi:MarR family winged helix-turn-helix transcriptional regulator [Paractinoplanes rhizophilus]|jgi:DNA-binding MarR family transcriptional regulator|uniref:MarR family winged helix-turn-helix transcriptional regulator n=1 Tax=Paractinoplanes rhizophilus TaxID=1416877 RepID=A0ABW2HZR5_9ACTN|nr:MarR family winged helix-turn-helix transcriptional regulator [Actinoplanes sp.]
MEDIAEELRVAIGRFVRATREGADSLPPIRAEAMGYLSREGPMSIAELAAYRGVRHQSMSRVVGDLEALGFVARAPDPADARAFVITLTPAGESALQADRAARRDWVAAAIEARLTPAEGAMLRAVPALLHRLAGFGDKRRPEGSGDKRGPEGSGEGRKLGSSGDGGKLGSSGDGGRLGGFGDKRTPGDSGDERKGVQ